MLSRSIRLFGSVIAVAMVVVGCGESGGSVGILGVSGDDVSAAEEYFAGIEADNIRFEELRASGIDEAALRAYIEASYSPEIVFHDATFGDHREGYDELESMFEVFLYYFDDATIAGWPTLVGNPTALSVIPFWGVTLGPWEFTEAEPLIEVDLMEMDGDRIASNTLFYDLASIQMMSGGVDLPALDGGLQQAYADAWTSGDAAQLGALYADGAIRHDGLAGVDAVGLDSITGEAEHWTTALPGATWTVRLPFAERYAETAGAVFDVTYDECSVEIGILFDLDTDGRITQELVHYDPDSLRTCNWVE